MTRFRTEKSHAAEEDLSVQLHKKLLPGVKTGQSAAERLEAYNVSGVKTLVITKQGIRFATHNFFFCLHEYHNIPVNGSIYQLYTVGLAAVECKVSIANRNITGIQDSLEDYTPLNRYNDFIVAAKSFVVLPDQLTSIVNAIGTVTCHDSLYAPRIGRDRFHRQNVCTETSNFAEQNNSVA